MNKITYRHHPPTNRPRNDHVPRASKISPIELLNRRERRLICTVNHRLSSYVFSLQNVKRMATIVCTVKIGGAARQRALI